MMLTLTMIWSLNIFLIFSFLFSFSLWKWVKVITLNMWTPIRNMFGRQISTQVFLKRPPFLYFWSYTKTVFTWNEQTHIRNILVKTKSHYYSLLNNEIIVQTFLKYIFFKKDKKTVALRSYVNFKVFEI